MLWTSLYLQQLRFACHNLMIHFSNKTRLILKVLPLEHVTLDHRGVYTFGPRHQQNNPALTMEQLESAPGLSDTCNHEHETVTPTVSNELSETGKAKRKSEETDESEKSGRGKRKRGGGGKKLRPGERYIPPPQRRNPGVSFSKEHFDETTYYFEGGLRKVHPYYYDFKTYCKGRWIGKSLLEVFSSEFRSESIDYYKRAAKEGRIRLNETTVDDLSIILRNNDLMRNTVHRHEPPVVGRPLDVLVDNGEVLVVNKPASIPVHPCGRFRHNTVIFILGKDLGVSELHTVHRLDRLTSGVLLFARTLEMSKKLDQLVRDRQLVKEYVCRVDGEFPEEELVCEEPILVVSFKVGLCRVDAKGKDCRTVFQRISFNGSSSVVRCLPLTGRTHQIRVHLQYLGFPILNDPVYGASAWGPRRGKGGQVGMSDEDLLKALVEEHRSKESLHLLDLPDDEVAVVQDEGPSGAEVSVKEERSDAMADGAKTDDKAGESGQTRNIAAGTQECESTVNPEMKPTGELCAYGDSAPETKCSVPCQSQGNRHDGGPQQNPPSRRDHLCSECRLVRPDPSEKDLIMYLHALRYKGPDFEYSTHLPEWAKDDWVEDD